MDKPEFSEEYKISFFAKKEASAQEFKRLNQKVREYKKRIKSKDFNISIQWETDLSKIDLSVLQTEISAEVINKFPEAFTLVYLGIDWVVEHNYENHNIIYPKNNLWAIRTPISMARLLDTIENGSVIIPPMIRPVAYNQISIMDGHHRIALCRYLSLVTIPFLVEKEHIELLSEIN